MTSNAKKRHTALVRSAKPTSLNGARSGRRKQLPPASSSKLERALRAAKDRPDAAAATSSFRDFCRSSTPQPDARQGSVEVKEAPAPAQGSRTPSRSHVARVSIAPRSSVPGEIHEQALADTLKRLLQIEATGVLDECRPGSQQPPRPELPKATANEHDGAETKIPTELNDPEQHEVFGSAQDMAAQYQRIIYPSKRDSVVATVEKSAGGSRRNQSIVEAESSDATSTSTSMPTPQSADDIFRFGEHHQESWEKLSQNQSPPESPLVYSPSVYSQSSGGTRRDEEACWGEEPALEWSSSLPKAETPSRAELVQRQRDGAARTDGGVMTSDQPVRRQCSRRSGNGKRRRQRSGDSCAEGAS